MKFLMYAFVCMAGVVACDQNGGQISHSSASSVAAVQHVHADKNAHVYKVISYPYTPFVIRGDNGEIVGGLETEILQAIAQKEQIEFEFIPPISNLEASYQKVRNHTGDLLSAGTYTNAERQQIYEVSKSYMDTQFALLSKREKINGLAGLKNKRVALMPDSIAEKEVLSLPFANTITVVPIATIYDGVTAVVNDRADVLYTDKMVLTYYAKQLKKHRLVVSADEHAEPHQFAFMITKGNKELLDKVNKGLAAIEADGTLDRIKDKYLK